MLLSVRQASERLGVSKATIYGLVASGKLRASRVGLGRGAIRIQEEAVAEYLAATESGPERPTPSAPPRPPVRLKNLTLPA